MDTSREWKIVETCYNMVSYKKGRKKTDGWMDRIHGKMGEMGLARIEETKKP